ncbi:MAG: putative heme-binding domain-containing protein [Candidatus Azotimanducaceae bacterium]|jgi:putative heme-binding domain-containing protein
MSFLGRRSLMRQRMSLLGLLVIVSSGFSGASAYAASDVQDHTYSSQRVATGYQVYRDNCALCHGLEGAWIEGVDLSRAQFKTVVTDHELRGVILEGAGEGRMPRVDLNDEELDGVIAYIRIGFDPDGAGIKIGDATDGAKLFRRKGECGSCHRVNGQGPRTAPDLSDIGMHRTPAALKRSLVDPKNSLLPINRPVTLVTLNNDTISGRRLNEDTYSVQLIDARGQLRSVLKSDLRAYEVSEEPTHRPTKLSEEEVADLVGYLLSLRGVK